MIDSNLKLIYEDIADIKAKNNIGYPVNLMAVSKTFPKESVLEAINWGQTLFGENRILEAFDKFLPIKESDKTFNLHIIGHLQRNKSKEAVIISTMIESVDKIETLDAIEKEATKLNKKMDFLIEINTSFEPQKYGINPDDIFRFIETIQKNNYGFCNLRGVMTVGPLTDDKNKIRESFRLLKKLFDKVKSNLNKNDFDTISMGMSGDYRIAIEEGSNQLRIGSAIFGSR
ncbi:MAG TPA: YggS family pyridoxal phosphate-dependent enzyme [Spirochaetota bacterium]|nr:YggS family pyridoxal phosphate-dependent enzyme [Spirochaetota bacterium]